MLDLQCLVDDELNRPHNVTTKTSTITAASDYTRLSLSALFTST